MVWGESNLFFSWEHSTTLVGFGLTSIPYQGGDYATLVGNACKKCGRAHPVIRGIEGRWPEGGLIAKDNSFISMTAFKVHDDTFRSTSGYQFYQSLPGEAIIRIVPSCPLSDAEKLHILSGAAKRLQGQVTLSLEVWQLLEKTGAGKQLRVISKMANEKDHRASDS